MARLLKSVLLISSVLVLFGPVVFAEDITITTYYPSPYGSYSSLQTDKLGVGDNNSDGLFTAADVPTTTGNVWIKGNVGIGTVSPSYKLDVIGDVRATGSVYYGGSSGSANGNLYIKPDYVFKDGYKLMTTEEVEKYLKEQGHLPWMTSVDQEKKDNGGAVNITRMGFETVETVENLQLQIITLSNLIKEQQKEISDLKEKLAPKS